ncbi:MAG: serpin family protein [Bacteroidales bacterium]|nr:serpin family protein [Bacteroidales bacterium]MDZ4204159.1 serpin family protein [Bacteroidales bacterium]
MKRHIVFILSIVFATSCNKSEEVNPEPKVLKLTPVQEQLIDGGNRFGFDLLRQIDQAETPAKNLFISPLSVHLALGMAWNGAAGNTRHEMAQTMYFPQLSDEQINVSYKNLIYELLNADNKVEMGIANSIWYRNTFTVKKNFLDLNREYFDAEVQALDFNNPQSKNTINAWVANKTRNRIKEIVDAINHDHVMFVINAIYFKGIWKMEFKKSETRNRPFYLANGTDKQAMTMHTTASFAVASRPDYQVIELPYGRGNFSMLIFLPNNGVSPSQIINNLSVEEWNALAGELKNKVEVELQLPRFGFSYEQELKQPLLNMGIKDAFSEWVANFSGITDQQIFVSRVRHKTFVEVNEEGTEAAAVTSVEFSFTSMPPPPLAFHVNRPFVFALKEKYTNSLMFIGKVMDPSG